MRADADPDSPRVIVRTDGPEGTSERVLSVREACTLAEELLAAATVVLERDR